ncbi:MAG TPA: thioredoxin domain-containing protein [Candidatus Saccharimonadales bacterium]|nr:thioredoxin domain-containing protein [Candidatus Saccharimonadales bacterium]
MDKRFWGILVGILIILGGIFWLTSGKGAPTSTAAQPSEHVEGQGKDGVTLLEYGDYECPYCEEYYPIVKQVATDYSQQIYFQFRNLPLTQIHLNAFAGARAAEAASLQGQFWQMHDALYETQSQWVPSSDPQTYFDQYAQQLGLNVAKFEQDYSSTQVNNTINADVAAFNKTGAQEATPTFFLDGTQIQPAPTVASFQSFINAAIAKKTNSKTTTTAPTNTTGNQSVQK